MLQLECRQVNTSDLPLLFQYFPEPSSGQHKKRCEKQELGKLTYLIGFHNSDPVAIGLIRWNGSLLPDIKALGIFPEIGSIYVREQYRRKGAGSEMMRLLEEYAAAKGASKIGLSVNDTNSNAVNLYIQRGYRKLCKIPSNQFSPNEQRSYYVKQLPIANRAAADS